MKDDISNPVARPNPDVVTARRNRLFQLQRMAIQDELAPKPKPAELTEAQTRAFMRPAHASLVRRRTGFKRLLPETRGETLLPQQIFPRNPPDSPEV